MNSQGNVVSIPGSIAFLAGFTSIISDVNSFGKVMIADFNGDGSPDILSPLVANPLFDASSALFLNRGGLAFGLSASATSAPEFTGITLTATLSPTVTSTAVTGTVNFFANGVSLGNASVSSNTATLTLSTLPVGKDTITAAYSGDANYNAASASTGMVVTVSNPPAAAIAIQAPNPATIVVPQGASSSMVFSVAANTTFNGSVQLSCSGAPANTTCVVSPGVVNLSAGQSVQATLIVTTSVMSASAAPAPFGGFTGTGTAGILMSILVSGFSRRFRKAAFRKTWLMLVILAAGTVATVSMTGCGGSASKTNVTPAGVSTLTITATSGTVTTTQAVQLTVN